MRLLNTRTGEFVWVDDPRTVQFAILSHVWVRKGSPNYPEQTYQDLVQLHLVKGKHGESVLPFLSDKVRRFLEIAQNDGFELGWVDSCCIDKTSSSELSESINSMFNWYGYAAVCYAFLHDVTAPGSSDAVVWESEFRDSEYFHRGWTLQELIASSVVIFLSNDWKTIGSKHTLAPLIEEITKIDSAVLTFDKPLEAVPVARRMAWAATRVTTRVEDEAYSMMGIFGVNMQTNYGEGRYAFIRLQEEILKRTPDQTIFAWGRFLSNCAFTFANAERRDISSTPHLPNTPFPKQYLFASSPKDFKDSADLIHLSRDEFARRLGISSEDDAYQVFTPTPYGMQTRVPLVAVSLTDPHSDAPTHLALLACEDPHKGLLALLLHRRGHASQAEYSVGTIVGSIRDLVGSDEPFSASTLWSNYNRATYVSDELLDTLRSSLRMTSVYIPHYPSHNANLLERDTPIHAELRESRLGDRIEIRLSAWSRKLLFMQGYRVSPAAKEDDPLPQRPLTRTLSESSTIGVLNSTGDYVAIKVGRCSCDFGESMGLLGVLVSPRDGRIVNGARLGDQHSINHPVHIRSWCFRSGTASQEFSIETQAGRMLTLRLSLTRDSAMPSSGGDNPRPSRYRLGVEVRSNSPVPSPVSYGSALPLPAIKGFQEPYPTSQLPHMYANHGSPRSHACLGSHLPRSEMLSVPSRTGSHHSGSSMTMRNSSDTLLEAERMWPQSPESIRVHAPSNAAQDSRHATHSPSPSHRGGVPRVLREPWADYDNEGRHHPARTRRRSASRHDSIAWEHGRRPDSDDDYSEQESEPERQSFDDGPHEEDCPSPMLPEEPTCIRLPSTPRPEDVRFVGQDAAIYQESSYLPTRIRVRKGYTLPTHPYIQPTDTDTRASGGWNTSAPGIPEEPPSRHYSPSYEAPDVDDAHRAGRRLHESRRGTLPDHCRRPPAFDHPRTVDPRADNVEGTRGPIRIRT
ncbi:hypothetical protein BD310DRAFT_695237 [Dichomitus squalens]|uniref:Uncharacterized protein n=1 Tax=Dichomitus squalens TaxID=114155 RepID=A0A4Q9PM26_9APHY|nr:hypothetical protein BD310DRAFT_695237 [Dichomitus squalens]